MLLWATDVYMSGWCWGWELEASSIVFLRWVLGNNLSLAAHPYSDFAHVMYFSGPQFLHLIDDRVGFSRP